MYSSEKNPGFNWKDIIIKAIFLVVFLLLLVWLFPKVPNMKPFYSNVFRENIKYMQDAAESYYTNERLPKNIGDTAEMTLQEMINKNIILPFVDQDGNECDGNASYVQVKKNKNDYTLKVNLVCPTEKNYVEKTLGCYTYCEDCEEPTEVEQTEYQFKKPVTVNKISYSCPNGGDLKDGTCYIYKTNSYKATETTEKGTLYCPKGGVLKTDGKCYVSDTETYNASISTGGYYCPTGTQSGTMCYVNNTSWTYALTESYCPNGVLSGGRCYTSTPNTTVSNALIRNYTCPNGTVQSSKTCSTTSASSTIDATKSTKTINYTGTYLASEKPAGATCKTSKANVCTSSSRCPGYVTVYTSCTGTQTTYTCPTGYTRNGTKCYKAGTTTTTQGTPNYYCANGTSPVNGKCYTTTNNASSYLAPTRSYCANGTSPSNGLCYTYNSYSYMASKGNDVPYCPKGGKVTTGNKCVIDKSYSYVASKNDGKTVLTCPNGGELKDKTCYTNVVESSYKAKATTKKVTSYQYKWSTEQKLDGWTSTGQTRTTKVSADKVNNK